MKKDLTYSDYCILARNENEIRELVNYRKLVVENTDKDIKDLIQQNREILGRVK